MQIKDVDAKVGAKGRGGASGKPTKAISMRAPGEGRITKPIGTLSVRSAMLDADAQQFVGGMSPMHQYDMSTIFGGAGQGDMTEGNA